MRDLSCFERAVRLDVWCRRWRCREVLCVTKTWTEDVEALDATAVLTRRAGAEACRQVGQQARPVAAVARDFGGVLVDGDERGDRARHTAGRHAGSGRHGHQVGCRRDLLSGCPAGCGDQVRDRARRSGAASDDRHDTG